MQHNLYLELHTRCPYFPSKKGKTKNRPIIKGSDEYKKCLKNQRIFTHNKCLADLTRENERKLSEKEFTINTEMNYARTNIWESKTAFIWLGGSLLFVSLLLIIFRTHLTQKISSNFI